MDEVMSVNDTQRVENDTKECRTQQGHYVDSSMPVLCARNGLNEARDSIPVRGAPRSLMALSDERFGLSLFVRDVVDLSISGRGDACENSTLKNVSVNNTSAPRPILSSAWSKLDTNVELPMNSKEVLCSPGLWFSYFGHAKQATKFWDWSFEHMRHGRESGLRDQFREFLCFDYEVIFSLGGKMFPLLDEYKVLYGVIEKEGNPFEPEFGDIMAGVLEGVNRENTGNQGTTLFGGARGHTPSLQRVPSLFGTNREAASTTDGANANTPERRNTGGNTPIGRVTSRVSTPGPAHGQRVETGAQNGGFAALMARFGGGTTAVKRQNSLASQQGSVALQAQRSTTSVGNTQASSTASNSANSMISLKAVETPSVTPVCAKLSKTIVDEKPVVTVEKRKYFADLEPSDKSPISPADLYFRYIPHMVKTKPQPKKISYNGYASSFKGTYEDSWTFLLSVFGSGIFQQNSVWRDEMDAAGKWKSIKFFGSEHNAFYRNWFGGANGGGMQEELEFFRAVCEQKLGIKGEMSSNESSSSSREQTLRPTELSPWKPRGALENNTQNSVSTATLQKTLSTKRQILKRTQTGTLQLKRSASMGKVVSSRLTAGIHPLFKEIYAHSGNMPLPEFVPWHEMNYYFTLMTHCQFPNFQEHCFSGLDTHVRQNYFSDEFSSSVFGAHILSGEGLKGLCTKGKLGKETQKKLLKSRSKSTTKTGQSSSSLVINNAENSKSQICATQEEETNISFSATNALVFLPKLMGIDHLDDFVRQGFRNWETADYDNLRCHLNRHVQGNDFGKAFVNLNRFLKLDINFHTEAVMPGWHLMSYVKSDVLHSILPFFLAGVRCPREYMGQVSEHNIAEDSQNVHNLVITDILKKYVDEAETIVGGTISFLSTYRSLATVLR